MDFWAVLSIMVAGALFFEVAGNAIERHDNAKKNKVG